MILEENGAAGLKGAVIANVPVNDSKGLPFGKYMIAVPQWYTVAFIIEGKGEIAFCIETIFLIKFDRRPISQCRSSRHRHQA